MRHATCRRYLIKVVLQLFLGHRLVVGNVLCHRLFEQQLEQLFIDALGLCQHIFNFFVCCMDVVKIAQAHLFGGVVDDERDLIIGWLIFDGRNRLDNATVERCCKNFKPALERSLLQIIINIRRPVFERPVVVEIINKLSADGFAFLDVKIEKQLPVGHNFVALFFGLLGCFEYREVEGRYQIVVLPRASFGVFIFELGLFRKKRNQYHQAHQKKKNLVKYRIMLSEKVPDFVHGHQKNLKRK